MHRKVVLNRMEADYADSIIHQSYIAMGTMLCFAVMNDIYATRAIESGMQLKVLQQLLGHASIKTTIDR